MNRLSSLFNAGFRKPTLNNTPQEDEPHVYSREEIFELALKAIKQQYPSRLDHVLILSPGEYDEDIQTYYECDTTIAKQEGTIIRFPYADKVSSIYERVSKASGKRMNIPDVVKQLKDSRVPQKSCEYEGEVINLQMEKDDIANPQEEYVIANQTKICKCEDCGGEGYKPCPDEECRGRHEYTCPSCGGKGELVCKQCGGEKTVTCPRCDGKGENTCNTCKGEGSFICKDCHGIGEIKCRKCDGQGHVKCYYCNGTGHRNDGRTCPICGGSGHEKCRECLGKGTYICSTCKGKKTITCKDCDGQGKIVCRNCDGKKVITCTNCNGQGVVTCKRCKGEGIVICKTCLGDKEHYGKIACPTCGASGSIAQIVYIKTTIETVSKNNARRISNNKESVSILTFVPKERNLKLIYKRINGELFQTDDSKALKIAREVDNKNRVSKDSDNPQVVKQFLYYHDVQCIILACQHIITKDKFNISIMDLLGNPVVLFPDYDRKKQLKTGLFEGIGYGIARLFKTKKHLHRMDCFCMYRLYIGLVRADGVMDENEKRLLIDKLSEFDFLTPKQQNYLWEILDSESSYTPTKYDVSFSSREVASEALDTLRSLAEVDGNVSKEEAHYINLVTELITA